MIEFKNGNIFNTECEVIVNTINCVGFMGAGIAYEFKLKFPDMYDKYKEFCDDGSIDIGKLWIYKTNKQVGFKKVLNFPTKKHYKFPSKIEYLRLGLDKFIRSYKSLNIKSIAFPLLGADKGGLDQDLVIKVMKEYLEKVDILVEIWSFDKNAKENVLEYVIKSFDTYDNKTLKSKLKGRISENVLEEIRNTLKEEQIVRMLDLGRIKGVGETALSSLMRFSYGI